ncbi:MAG: cellobiose phosphorylase [Clostridiales bacterium]|nr:cellobiose phosphorylase [Clostridiales bacterium]
MSYYFKDNQFVIENYDKQKTFSSFLPGIAGVKGIPIWAFYANRGQGITSFGIKDKNEPILEFFPANTSYQYVDKYGFRSFVRVDGEYFEPFAVNTHDDVVRNMYISREHFSVEEINKSRNIHYKVTYFGLTNEPIAGLVRTVEIINLGENRLIDVVDGIANILPSGATNESYKNMSNLMVSWMGVENIANNIPFYKFRASSGDEAEVSSHSKGHFYLSFIEDHELIRPIVDLELIFGYDTSLTMPFGLMGRKLADLDLNNQVIVNKVPCGFTPVSKTVPKGVSIEINTIIGHVSEVSIINQKAISISKKEFITGKFKEAVDMIDSLVDVVDTKSNFPLFDAYIKQNFLDNTLRGGYPLVFGEGDHKKVYHVFSRKHGDPERDYNFFTLSPEFYSQGNGNFRDVNQNRRNDVFFVPDAGIFNVKVFMDLIQLDGYNPLGVQGTTFTIDEEVAQKLIDQYVTANQEELKEVFKGKFTPGKLGMQILLNEVELRISEEAFMDKVLSHAIQHVEAVFGEGFWVDHWTYNFDLIESYLSIFPDQLIELLYKDTTYQYFDSPVTVLPRNQKHGLDSNGEVRQYGAIEEEAHSNRFNQSNWVRKQSGEIYKTNLVQKLLTLVLNKFSSLDPYGMGIEMEANKPGWNDAMNGLPGVFASGMSETIELVRIVRFLKGNCTKEFSLLEENYDFFIAISRVLSKDLTLFQRWDELATIRENFRERIKTGINGREVIVSSSDLISFLDKTEKVLMDGVQRSKECSEGMIPTYLTYTATDYEALGYKTPYGLDAVKIKSFDMKKVPSFLEAPARSFKIGTTDENTHLYSRIKASDLYDEALKTYKTSGMLDEMSYELGRIRAFTPGWLERESNFLHMTYKYILGLLKGGLYDEFFEEIKSNLVCFMDPNVYGRSTLENSSFIASSLNPNPRVRGQGFVARLSGSTAEMLSIWNIMMFGESVFQYTDELVFSPRPILHADFFHEGRVRTTLLSTIEFIIENETSLSTYSEQVMVDYYLVDGKRIKEIRGDLALKIRTGQVRKIVMVYKRK